MAVPLATLRGDESRPCSTHRSPHIAKAQRSHGETTAWAGRRINTYPARGKGTPPPASLHGTDAAVDHDLFIGKIL